MLNITHFKRIKRIPIALLILIGINVAMCVFICFNSIGKVKIIDVHTKQLKANTYQQIKINENRFQTGTEGKLYWKVKNLKEAVLIVLADRNHPFNLYDLFYLVVLDIALFIMVYRMKEDSVFSDQVVLGLKTIAYAVILYPAIILLSYHFSAFGVEELTQAQFTANTEDFNVPKYLVIAYLIIFMIPFIEKGIRLQQEQNLTI